MKLTDDAIVEALENGKFVRNDEEWPKSFAIRGKVIEKGEDIIKLYGNNKYMRPYEFSVRELKSDKWSIVNMDREPMIMLHELKILPEYFNEVQSHNKQFEIRKDDRDYRVGDWILFKEFESGSYTGRTFGCVRIRYILRNCSQYGLMDGYCIIGWGDNQ